MPVPDTYKPSDTKPESKHLRAEDFPIDQKWRLTIEDVTLEEMPERDNKPARKRLVLHFQGREKGLVLNMTNQSFIGVRMGQNPNDWIGATVVPIIRLPIKSPSAATAATCSRSTHST